MISLIALQTEARGGRARQSGALRSKGFGEKGGGGERSAGTRKGREANVAEHGSPPHPQALFNVPGAYVAVVMQIISCGGQGGGRVKGRE